MDGVVKSRVCFSFFALFCETTGHCLRVSLVSPANRCSFVILGIFGGWSSFSFQAIVSLDFFYFRFSRCYWELWILQWCFFHSYKLSLSWCSFRWYVIRYIFSLFIWNNYVCFVVSILIVCVFVEDLYPLTKPSKNSGVTMNWWFRSCRRIDFRARRDTTSVRSHFNNGTLKSLQSGTCYNRVELEVPAINLPKFAFRLLT